MSKAPAPGAWRERRTERRLLLSSLLAVAAGYLMVMLVRMGHAPGWRAEDWMPLGLFAASVAGVHLVFTAARFRGDPVLLSAAMLLSGLGLLEQFRLGTLDLARTDKWSTYAFPAGMAAMVACALLFSGGRHKLLEKLSMLAGAGAIGVLAILLVAGQRFRGAMYLGGQFNPSEIAKVLLVLFLAGFFAAYRGDLAKSGGAGLPAPSGATVLALGLFWGVPMVLLLLLRDLGMIMLMTAVFVVLLCIATGRWSYLIGGLLVCFAAGWALLRFMPHSQARFAAWSDPFEDPTGKGWQILQSLSALYSGGLWGAGLGSGHPHAIPIAASDFVYSALGEEIGYAGCGLLLLVYLVFLYRGFRVADSLRDPFAQYLAAGLVALFAFQTLLNVGGVTKAIPLTGLTLPFVSHGGSSLMTSLAALGLMLALSAGEAPQRKEAPAAKKPRRKSVEQPEG